MGSGGIVIISQAFVYLGLVLTFEIAGRTLSAAQAQTPF